MSMLDLEKLQGAWRQHSQRVEASLALDVEGVRNRLKLGTRSAFNRHLRWLRLEIVFGATTLLALLAFIIKERTDVVYLAASLPLLAMLLFAFGTDIRHWRILSTLDLSAALVQVRTVLDAVRARRLLVAKWIGLSACLLWLPLIAVLLKAIFGLDLLRGLHFSVIAVNVALGVLLIPIGLLVFGWVSKRFAHAPAFQSFVEDASGASFSAARASFQLEADFETNLDSSETAAALAHLSQNQWPLNADVPLRRLRTANLCGILLSALLVLANGSFSFQHGGDVQTLVPGIFLHLFLLLQMISGIVYRVLLAKFGASSTTPLTTQIQSLTEMAHWRGNVARLSIVLTPLLALALAQVLAKATFAIDLYQAAGTSLALTAVASALLLSTLLYLRWHDKAESFARKSSNAVAFGVLKLSQGLHETLGRKSAR